jgi:hypothetical protein
MAAAGSPSYAALCTNHLLRPGIRLSFSPSWRLYEPEAGRPRVFLREAQAKLTLQCTETYASGPSPWLPGRTTMSTISRRRLVHNAGWSLHELPLNRV